MTLFELVCVLPIVNRHFRSDVLWNLTDLFLNIMLSDVVVIALFLNVELGFQPLHKAHGLDYLKVFHASNSCIPVSGFAENSKRPLACGYYCESHHWYVVYETHPLHTTHDRTPRRTIVMRLCHIVCCSIDLRVVHCRIGMLECSC
jgi:hypothetical protein